MGNKNIVLEQLSKLRVIPVIRTKETENAVTAVLWLREAGFRTFEITLTTPDAINIIVQLTAKKDALIGAGTVTSVNQAKKCIEAGAQYIVSPCVVPDLPAICHQYDIPCILGACTPTELHLAMEAEADAIKIFPVSLMGGSTYIKTLSSIFPGVPLIPTGGIKLNEVQEYLESGAICVGLGGVLVNETLIQQGERRKILKISLEIIQQATKYSS
ncbi:MAG: bifunctional 4-hydroxy-2-oxoglutarate aldolase/2-dehydro-3-deoxy-phosphogluconate aldolase [SAR324 cluster bacterium]|nr:bifunctional 4-hydroxy-2-oxoglutarate aldolase/2-dehydro-3-deoxy-phosphogluconate aldolase [SAR324 cluster bacterium]